MSWRRAKNRHAYRYAVLLVCALVYFPVWAQDLSIRVGGSQRQVDSRSRDGVSYYSLRDLARILGLSLRSGESVVQVSGARGVLELERDRPLIRSGSQYILLDAASWEAARGDWYVPLDFVEKVLPSILDRRLARTGDRSFSVESVNEVAVRVDVLTYPDHHSVVFRMNRSASVDVQEFHGYIDVAYQDTLVRPGAMERPPNEEVIAGISFEPQEAMGTFRVRKGPGYQRFRHYRLSDPPRLVLDLYGRPATASRDSLRDATADALSGAVDSPGDRPPGDLQIGPAYPPAQEGLVIVDAGHGAEDYGVDSHQEVLEKVLVLELARKIERQLELIRHPARLTRSRDVAIPLDQRAAIANFYRAAAFVTLHLGAAPSPGIRGPMVYVLSIDPEPHQASSGGRSSEEAILKPWNQAQVPFLEESRRLAGLMQTELNRLFGVENPVSDAPLVLLGPIEAPAILIETGFLTNPADLELLGSPEFRDRLALVIARTLVSFLEAR